MTARSRWSLLLLKGSRGFCGGAAWVDRNTSWLRRRRLRRMHGFGGRRTSLRLPGGPSAGSLPSPRRRTMWSVHAGHAGLSNGASRAQRFAFRGRRDGCVSIVQDAIETLKAEDGHRTVAELQALGANFITTDQALMLARHQ
jgi:hypothetical protein